MSPAAPVPGARYLDQSGAFGPGVALVLPEEHMPNICCVPR